MEEQSATALVSAWKLKSLIKPMSWLRKNKGGASFSVYESSGAVEEVTSAEELSSTSRQLSDDENRFRTRSSVDALGGGLSGRRELGRRASASGSGRSRKTRRKYDPRRYVGRHAVEVSQRSPPRGYLWLWLGHFKRWQRRFFVLTTPGALTYGKRPDMEGGKWTLRLGCASVLVGKGNSRQFCLRLEHRVVYLRTLSREDRDKWVEYLERSIEKYREMVERTKKFAGRERPRLSEDPHAYSLDAEVDPQMHRMQRDLWVHVQAKMATLQPHREELEKHLGEIGNGVARAMRALGHSHRQAAPAPVEQQTGHRAAGGGDAEWSNNRESTANSTNTSEMPDADAAGVADRHQSQGQHNSAAAPSVWEAYNNLMAAVEQVIKDEGVRKLELQAENSALRKLLRDRHGDTRALGRASSSFKDSQTCLNARDEQGNMPLDNEADDTTSMSSSRSYSTAGSQFVPDREDNEFLAFKAGDITEEIAMGSPSRTVLDDDLIAALEVVRQVEYVTKGHVMSEFDGETEEPPTDGVEGEEDLDLGAPEV